MGRAFVDVEIRDGELTTGEYCVVDSQIDDIKATA